MSESVSAGGSTPDPGALVREFHEAFGLIHNDQPTLNLPNGIPALRQDLLAEEVEEYETAVARRDLVGIADALADITYVVYGTALTYGIDLDAVLVEVHRSNMSKLGASGRPLYRQDGKVMKGSNYSPPDIAGVLSRGAADD